MIEANTAARLAARFATLAPAQRRAFLDKMAEQGIAFTQLPIPALPRPDAGAAHDAPLSYAQQRQWFLHRFEPDSAAYHISSSVELRGTLDVTALHDAFAVLARRHDALRTAFIADADGRVTQRIHPGVAIELPVTDLSANPALADAQAAAIAEAPFDLGAAPLLRVHLLKLGEQAHRLVLVMHHIVSDGWSMQLLIDDLAAAYRARLSGQALALADTPIGYGDFAAWQRNWLEAGERERQLAWWIDTLAGAPDVLALPTDRPRPAAAAYVAERCEIVVPDALAATLRARAQAQGGTLFMALLAGFHALLHRYTGSADICVGMPVAGRNRIETERVVGLFVNTQIVRGRIDGRQPLSTLLDHLRHAVLGAQAHQDLPFEQLVEALQPARSMSYHPLFQVVHNHRRGDRAARVTLPGLELESAPVGERTTALELTLDTREDSSGRIHACFHYARELFDASTAQRLARHYLRLLEQLADDPAVALDAVDLLDLPERHHLLALGQGTAPADDCLPVHAHIARHAAAQPDSVAVICGNQTLRYGELLARADRLAATLHARGIGAEDRVGIALSRSPDIIVALLAVMRAGAAYVPFDPAYPRDRLAYLFEDSAIRLLVTEPALLDTLPAPASLPVLTPDMVAPDTAPLAGATVHPDQLAYVIYTSGSTGRPKGVCVSHGPLAMHVAATIDAYEMGPDSRELHFLSFAFDGAHERWLCALACGGSLVLRDDTLWTPEQTAAAMARHGVTNAGFPPAYLRQLAEHCEQAGQHPPVALYSFGGEAMPRGAFAQARRALGAQTYINGYGPTETVVTPMVWKVRAEAADFAGTYAPIGRPVGDRRCYLLDAELNLVPPGVAGELYIGGQGLARGYLNRPAMTAERFVPDPFADDGARLYRTGDLARWLPDGQLEYLGRIDQQLKIRGFRIEPGEIEARILAQDGVGDAAVLAVEGPSGARLAAYVVPAAGAQVDLEAIRAVLAAELPDYMVPAAFVRLDALPMTPNGKLDRRALPAPAFGSAQAFVAPEGEPETTLAAIWTDVLGVPRVGRADNFFELGGDSILSLQIVARARAAGWVLTPRQLFERQTLSDLAAVAVPVEVGASSDDVPHGAVPLLPIQADFFDQPMARRHHWNQSVLLDCRDGLDADSLRLALRDIVTHHDALRLRFFEETGDWRQSYAEGEPGGDLLWTREAASEAERLAHCDAAQRSLDIERGPLLRAVALQTGGAWQLLLVIHHLVVDGVSWRVLVEDLLAAYQARLQGAAPMLPARTASFQRWALALCDAARTRADELPHWQALAGLDAALPARDTGAPLTMAARAHVHLSLPADLTQALLQRAPAAYRTRVNDLLLTALARAVSGWTQRANVLIALESHGRAAGVDDGIDLSRTVGWFTTLFPVALDASGVVGDAIRAVKEQLRAVPGEGIGFGLLRRFGTPAQQQALAALPRPEIVFNYLGQVDGTLAEGPWQRSPAATGANQDAATPLSHPLSVSGQVQDGQLRLSLAYARGRYRPSDIEDLGAALRAALEDVVAHCTSGASGLTPSDFPLARLSQSELDALRLDPATTADLYPLSPMQTGMLFHSVFADQGSAYTNQLRVDVAGVDPARFTAAWQAALARHDSLRCGFLHRAGHPLQWVARDVALPIVIEDWTGRGAADIDAFAASQRAMGFDLARPPLMRVALLRTGPERHHLIWTVHHLLLDGWSTAQLLGEVLRHYGGEGLPPTVGRFGDYIGWLQSRDAGASRAFWEGLLSVLDQPTRLLAALPAPADGDDAGQGEHHHRLDAGETATLAGFARAQKVTLNTLVQAAWLLVLQRCTNQSSVAFGATVAGRPADLPAAQQMLGLFINTLPVVAAPRPDTAVGDWLRDLQARNLAIREHEHTPLYDIQRWAGHGGQALFDSIVVFENYPVDAALRRTPGGLAFSNVRNLAETNYPLTLLFAQNGADPLHLTCRFDRALLADAQARQLAASLFSVLRQMAADAARPLAGIGLLAPADALAALAQGTACATYPPAEPVHRLFEAQAAARPDAIALCMGDQSLTYAALNRRANALAHRLIARGVGPDVPVGVLAERSVEMVVALLAVLKAGGAYVPFDPDYPADRLGYMIGDSGVALVLVQRLDSLPALPPLSRAITPIDLNAAALHDEGDAGNPTPALSPENLAYIIYTSGSTGRPKGAANRHGALFNRLWWMQQQYRLDAADTVLQKTPFSFDVSVWEFFWPLMTGARLAMAAPGDHRDPQRIAALIAQHRVTTLHFVPSMLQAFVADAGVAAHCGSLRHIVCSGEALPADLARRAMALLPHAGLHNLYGPTEAAIDVTHWTCRADLGHSVPIGRPIANVSAHVLDAALQPVPDGVAGELYLGGAGLARGYLGRAALTAERFVADPHGTHGDRLYRTGDLARRLAGGKIEYLGRLDHQVKIRGLRIEPGEIEARLLAHEGVREAIVIAQTQDGPARLVAYVVPSAGVAPQPDSLRHWLAQTLPDYMVPGAVIVLERMPVTPNGKLDRRALPSPGFTGTAAYEAPGAGVETLLAGAWSDVLKVARVGRADNFFELGGDSILSLQIVARLRAEGWHLTPKHLFELQTLAAVAAAAIPLATAEAMQQRGEPLPRPRRDTLQSADFPLARLTQPQLDALALDAASVQDIYPLSPMQAGMLYHSVARADAGSAYINQLRVDIDGLDPARFAQAWRDTLAAHDTLRTGFVPRGDQPLQWVAHDVPLPFEAADWSGRDDQAAALDALAAAELARGFDLERPPLMRLMLVRTGAGRHHLVWTVHHLLVDGWSTSQLLGEVLQRYTGEHVAAPAGRFADYIGWLQSRDAGAARTFWAGALDGFDTPTRLAEALQAPSAGKGYGLLQHACSPAMTERLAAFARTQKVTLNTVVQAAWLLLLQRYTGQRRVAFGATVAGRPAEVPGAQQMLGLFINTLPVIAAPQPDQQIGDWLRDLQAFNVSAREHGHTPLSDIQRWGGQAGQRLFDSILVFENFPLEDALEPAARSGLRFETQGSTGLTEYEMDVEVSLRQTLRLGFTYMRRAFDATQVERLCAQMMALLDTIDTAGSVGQWSLLDAGDRAALQQLGQGTPPADDCLPVHAHIARHAAAQPDSVAVICGDQTLRYGELLARADRLAATLHARGIGAEDRVGIALSRSPDIIVALLAVMRAGAAYVPFDPAYPRDRLAYLFDDSAIRLLVTEPALLDTLPAPASLPVLTPDMVAPDTAPLAGATVHPDQLAYVIYTSGSTGRPKGVCVSHGPLAMHVAATIDAYEMGPDSRELHFLSFAFDGAHERWLCALACGGSLVLRDDTLWTPEQTAAAMARHGVTNAGFPPAYLRQLAEHCEQAGQHPPVALYSFGGEAMPRGAFAQARRALGAQTYINGYGPTETVVTPMVWKVRAEAADFAGTYAPIGRPVGDRRCYLLDAELNLVPPGVAGELYIGGQGLARGYLNRPAMTAERFVPDPFADDGARLYRTGDLARWLPDGQLEYLGRIDQQLKIRGFRIEPGEIEARILAQDGVGDAAVLAVEGPSGARLAAYVVPAAGAQVDLEAIRAVLAAELPDYMVPAAFVRLDALPMTPNGKLDRRALPAPESAPADHYVAPRTEAQRWLAQVWQDVLGVERVGLDDNFFTLGGDSLLSLKVISRVRANSAAGVDLKLRDLMRTPTIGQLLPDGEVAQAAPAATPTALRVLAQGPADGGLPPVACVHAALGTLFDYDAIVAQLGRRRTVYGFQSRALGDPAWRDASLAALAADYVREWRAVQPQGPYLLLGWSVGATVATWMARELERQGETVQWLGLVDPFVPEATAQDGASPGWPAALQALAARLLPGTPALAVPEPVAATPDVAGVAALLAPLVARTEASAVVPGADELAQMFVAGHRLSALVSAETSVPVVRAPRSTWWRAGRDSAIARLAGWQGEPARQAVLDGVDHHAIVRDSRLLADLGDLAGTHPGEPSASVSGHAAESVADFPAATLPT
ncbi:non-ribosomal peptide synthetase [Cupriavidus agavae]|uniref:Non-ribosomal peptide synthase protein (TIGR01720 family)/amino acid adenylation domain-containing protein n=1 Tax=Cupriavidus agavae TaxID=1001822 RepID=A0A4Q7RZ45_9BURK|nr:non-ribosomal peptide synthetase [Cupriavidus agavae]RZT39144.1 non-ribosomal peptide synthase protein (TIGR01720 family)/amino acid adenylation domain-containing protein [Cupriavidus agavae]